MSPFRSAVAAEVKTVTEHLGNRVYFMLKDVESDQSTKGESVDKPGNEPGFCYASSPIESERSLSTAAWVRTLRIFTMSGRIFAMSGM